MARNLLLTATALYAAIYIGANVLAATPLAPANVLAQHATQAHSISLDGR